MKQEQCQCCGSENVEQRTTGGVVIVFCKECTTEITKPANYDK